MNRLLQLRQQKHDIKAEANQILATAEQNGKLAAGDKLKLDGLRMKLAKTEGELAEEEALVARDRDPRARLSASEHQPGLGITGSGRKYRDMFPDASGNWGFKSFNEYLGVIHSGMNDSRFQANANEGVPSEGGFYVPPDYAQEILDSALEDEIVRPRCRIIPMISASKKIAAFDDLTNTTGPYGFSTTWLSEAGVGVPQTAKTRLIELIAHKLALFSQVSNELVEDGSSYESMLGEALKKATAWGIDLACFTGSGAGQPLGALNDPALITVSAEGGQSAATIVTANILKMFARCHPACIKNAVWCVNSTAFPQLAALTLGTGTAVVLLLSQEGGKWYMLGREVLFTEKLPALGAKGDIMLVDWSQYALGLRREVSIDKSQHVGWQTDESGYRAILRMDGQGTWGKPFTPKNGDTTSWAVALEAR
ncbi:MAG: phage major capsid protein [Acidobacteriaceae bacterium]